MMEPKEWREWIEFFIIAVVAIIALRTYIVSQRQRRLENSIKILEIFFSNLENGDIAEWKHVLMGSSEPSGAKEGHFHSHDGVELSLDSLFSEGPDDDGAINRIIDQINIISHEVLKDTVDIRFIYSRIGQLMNSTYKWFGGNNRSIIHNHYVSFEKVVKKYRAKFKKWPSRTYLHCE